MLDRGHYWWLTWTWENLLFACARCNDQGHKGNYFPLKSAACSTPPRTPGQTPPHDWGLASESPHLIDPATEDPLRLLRWKPVDASLPRSRWTWEISSRSEKGRKTIKTLGLRELAEDVAMHLSTSVLPSVEEIERELLAGRLQEARARWAELLARVLAPETSLSFASWCALRRWMPLAERTHHGLARLPRPGAFPSCRSSSTGV